jgi:uncharacterized protein
MFGRLLPREVSFFDHFEKHARITLEGARALVALFADGTKGRPLEPLARRIKDLEHEADLVTHQCMEALHRTFITPIEREDIHQLISRMDDVMDFIEAASERALIYELTVMRPDAGVLAGIVLESVSHMCGAIEGLRDMKHARVVIDKCIEINRCENEGDAALRRALARLFKEEKDPIAVIKWKEIFDYLEEAMDRCEDVANVLEGVVLEHA